MAHRPGVPKRDRSVDRRNPPASPAQYRQVARIVAHLPDEVDPSGRAAVVLAGSWSTGDAHELSDIDLWVVGPPDRRKYLEREGYLVAVKYGTAADERREMRHPLHLYGAVPGWRDAKIVRDPRGVARRLQAEARRFRWSTVRRSRDAYLATQLASWAEEVAKLLRALATGETETASVQRNLLANQMVFLRLLPLERFWRTENGLWEKGARWAGPEFRDAQRSALGTDGSRGRESCEAALRLYALTARANLARLHGEKRRLVLGACRRAGYPVEERRSRGR